MPLHRPACQRAKQSASFGVGPKAGVKIARTDEAFELRNRLGSLLKVSIPAAAIWSHPTIAKLGERSATLLYQGYRHRDGELSVTAATTLACVRTRPRSLPAWGSVRHMVASHSPVATFSR